MIDKKAKACYNIIVKDQNQQPENTPILNINRGQPLPPLFGVNRKSFSDAEDLSKPGRAEALTRELDDRAEEKAKADLGDVAVPSEVELSKGDDINNGSGYQDTLELEHDSVVGIDNSESQAIHTLPTDQTTGQIPVSPTPNGELLPPSQTQGRPFIGEQLPSQPRAPSGTNPFLGE